jgi:Tfp pilus assembly protein PilN
MGTMMLMWLIVVVVAALLLARIVTRQLPSAPSPDQDRLLAAQAERIEQLEDEIQQVREQADFTERLLTDRSESPPQDVTDERDPTD